MYKYVGNKIVEKDDRKEIYKENKKFLTLWSVSTNSMQINLFPVILDNIRIWPPLGKLIFLEHQLFKNTFNVCICHSKQSVATESSSDRIMQKRVQLMKFVSENFPVSSEFLTSLFLFILFFCLLHTFFNNFDYWFSWELWHHKRTKCVIRTESLREVGLKWLFIN